ncbi:SdiA-regulated domain-containing protein [Mucilaginibacter ginsenosidivorax]|uniref:SdiA-regulated family protein n=1 Tax=Mucilaginibacter ginsenosidivorax TaxID=862126 RepID=A0A5B8W9H7_9SPHI|nr:SdiA-regulated domain-containing protein [Mucilaginibacter ginsenosidivorax]QEC80097.1 SdiA-regulated family protein [Mucilaginibacter ginsenosidivorax]
MIKDMRNTLLGVIVAGILLSISCANKTGTHGYDSPTGYNLNKPVKYYMPDGLLEISGIAFNNGKSDSVYAEQDEDGNIYYLKLGDKQVSYSKFGKKGDYEDIAICHKQVIMLRSDGVLFTFPFSQVRNKEIPGVQKLEGLLPDGEYEGMHTDDKSGLVYVLCKHCADDNTTKSSSGTILALQADGTLKQSGSFSVDVKTIEKITGKKKVNFHPSALTQNSKTGEWYILSSVNKMLVVADSNWSVKAVYSLDPAIFNQPEGMAFDNQYNLYISNEGSKTSAGNIFKFNYTK